MSPPLTTVSSGISEKFPPKLQGTAGCRDSSAATVDVLSPTFPSQIAPPGVNFWNCWNCKVVLVVNDCIFYIFFEKMGGSKKYQKKNEIKIHVLRI